MSSLRTPLLLALLLSPALTTASPDAQDKREDRRYTDVVRVVEQRRPAVVSIESTTPQRQELQGFWRHLIPSQKTTGSGFVIFDDGFIVTNFHVVNGATQIIVRFDREDDPTPYRANVVSSVPEEDLALLKIEDDGPFPTIPLSDTEPILGETVIAIGSPFGQSHTVSTGIVSGKHRNIQAGRLTFEGLIQTDASINPGNSGGPLLNINGDLIGINTVMNRMAENIGFAIPVPRLRQVLDEHLLSASNQKSWFGFELDEEQLTIASVQPDGPADIGGLRSGDRILAVDDKPLETREAFLRAVIPLQPHQEVSFAVERQGQSRRMQIVGWTTANGDVFRRSGMTVEPYPLVGIDSRGMRDQLVRVNWVQADSPAAELGLQVGDLIEVAQPPGRRAYPVRTTEELAWLLNRLEPGDQLEIEMWRDEDEDGALEQYPGGYSELYRGSLKLR